MKNVFSSFNFHKDSYLHILNSLQIQVICVKFRISISAAEIMCVSTEITEPRVCFENHIFILVSM